MSPDQINVILERLARLEEIAAETLRQTRLTNGRVGRLEAWKIETNAVEQERARAHAEADSQADDVRTERYEKQTRRDQIRNVILGAILALVGGVIAVFAADIHPFS